MKRHHLRTILATSDFSPGSDTSISSASMLATCGSAKLHAFHCVPQSGLRGTGPAKGKKARELLLAERRRELEEQVVRALGARSGTVSVAVGMGNPLREITRAARDVSADVIVLGPHSPRVAFDDLLGTTADRILRTCEVPCLLAHRAITRPIGRVLVATDFSRHARRALETVIDWVGQPGSSATAAPASDVKVEIVHVSAFATPFVRPIAPQALMQREIEAARRRITGRVRVALSSSIMSAPLEAEGVAAAAEKIQPDLVVLGTHGSGYLSRLLIGSVAYNVSKMTPFPLLVVPLHGGADAFS